VSEVVTVPADRLRSFCMALFASVGMQEEEAFVNADNLVDADLKGIDSHGVSRMPIHLKRLRLGLVRPNYAIKTVSDRLSAAVIDACDSMGPYVSCKAMDMAMAKAAETGVALVTVKNSNHNGTAGYYVERAIRQGMIGFAATNSPARMAPWGGRDPYFGTNPFAVGIPAGQQLPIVADMATSVVARGKVVIAAKNRQPIPLGWALNKDGEPTTDAAEGVVGSVLPFAGAKGSAIALVIDVLAGILSGSLFGPYIRDMYSDFKNPTAISHTFGAINIEAFTSATQFRSDIDKMIAEIKHGTPARSVSEIFLPGEIELRRRERRLREGVPLSQAIADDLQREGEECRTPCRWASVTQMV